MAYIRKTKDEYQLMSNYGYGWECELTEETLKEIRTRKKEYVENCKDGQFRIIKKRIEIND